MGFRQHRLVDGVPCFRCQRCRRWKPKGEFFTESPARSSKECARCRAKDDDAREVQA